MANRKVKGPSHFCEWVVGTTIESALGPIPKNKPPKKRDVVRVEVTTDDESEEDTVKITYPRTGRTNTPPPAAAEAKTTIKKVRFEDGPIKSALKQTVITTPVDSSDETSDSGSELETESSQSETTLSSDATDSDAESSEDSSKPKMKKKKKHKQKQIEADTESDWDSDPDPTCKCRRCTKGREILRRIGKKKSKESTPPSPETSESEGEEPPKYKHHSGKNKKKGAKKEKEPEPEPESETSDSAKDTSESEQETAPPKKQQRANKQQQSKKQGKQKGNKKQQVAPELETSESEPEPPKSKKQQKKEAKRAAKKAEEPEPEGDKDETSESAKETEDEAEPEGSPKQQNKDKQKNDNKKQNGKQAGKENQQSNKKKQKAGKESNKEPEAAEEAAVEEEVPATSKEQDQGKFKNVKGKGKAQSRYKDGVKKGNYPEGLPVPHMRRPQLIEPIRAQVVQTERVIETPEDPAPNAYYDAEHNVMRVYHGPVYGNHQNNALYPNRNGFDQPLPMGQPHPLQNPFYYGFNNPQQYPNYPQMSPYHQNLAGVPPPEAYSHIPITQGMAPPPWYATGGPPGFYPSNNHREKPHYGNPGNSSQGKGKGSHNNVGPPASLTGQNNPYLPKRNKSQFSAWGGSHRSVSKENSQPPGSVRAASTGWNDNSNNKETGNGWNDGAGDNNAQNDQNGWDTGGQDNNQSGGGWGANDNQASTDWNNPSPEAKQDDTWAPTEPRDNAQQDHNVGWGSGSNKSNETVRKAGDHWGQDTFPGASGSWDEQPKDAVSSLGQGADNNVGVWDTGNANGTEQPASSQGENGPDNVMPGTWVDTPAVTAGPSWGDSSAAQDTNGQAENW
ncbi:hypothetical protein ACHAPA_002559 [Fusarium lateritium]